MIKAIALKNFAAFEELSIDFSSKINVLIGENSCGKTQLLKAVYVLNNVQSRIEKNKISTKTEINKQLIETLLGLYKPENEKVGGICNKSNKSKEVTSLMLINENDEEFGCEISSSRASTVSVTGNTGIETDLGTFIPTKEILSLLPAIVNKKVSDDQLRALFDDTVFDICQRLLKSHPDSLEQQLNEDPKLGSLLPDLARAIGGVYKISGDEQGFLPGEYKETKTTTSQSQYARMYSDGTTQKFTSKKEDKLSIGMTAEGYRKIGVLQRLLENGELNLSDDSPLFWDEPESNMNPKLMKVLVSCLLELSRNGKQIILASHDYVLLKWFDLLADEGKGDHVRYHALYRDSKGKVQVETTDNYKMLASNAISETFSDLYDAEIERSLGASND